MQKKLLVVVVAVLILLGGVVFVWQKKMTEIQPLPAPEQNKEEDMQNVDTSDWKTYRNDQLGIQFSYPSEVLLKVDDSEGSIWGDNDEVMEEITLNREGKVLIWVLHVSKDNLDKYRKKLRDADVLAAQTKEKKISQGEYNILINGIEVIKIDSCSYSVAGVNCDLINSVYYFALNDGTYILVRNDPWWSGEAGKNVLAKLVQSFSRVVSE